MTHTVSSLESWRLMATTIWDGLGLPASSIDRLTVTSNETLPSSFPVTSLAVAAVGTACLAVSELLGLTGEAPCVSVDRRLASHWFGRSIVPLSWEMPAPWDPIAGDYRTQDGWIKLHTNAPHHRAAVLAVLQCDGNRDAVTDVVRSWKGDELESAIISANSITVSYSSSHQLLVRVP